MRASHFGIQWNRVSAGSFVVVILATGCTSSTEPPAEIHLEALTATSLMGTVASEVTVVRKVRATDRAGRPVSGIEISFAVRGGGAIGRTSDRTDGDGIATVWSRRLGERVGVYSLTAAGNGAADVVFTATAEPGPPVRIRRVSGNYQRAFVGDALPAPLQVRVADYFDNPVSRVPVTFAVISGNGTVAGNTAMTDSMGIATSGIWTLGPEPGNQEVSARTDRAQEVFTAFACDSRCYVDRLAYVRGGQIFTTDLSGDVPRQLTSDNSGRELDPAWSPDGKRIAFVRDYTRGGKVRSGAVLYFVDADGSNLVRRADGFHSPAWSPDGRRLAVTRDDCIYRCELYLMSADDDGKPPVFLASSAAFPAWSPDGKEIAYVSLSGDDGYHTTSGDSGTQERTGWPWLRLTNSPERSNDGGSPCTDRSRA